MRYKHKNIQSLQNKGYLVTDYFHAPFRNVHRILFTRFSTQNN